MAFLYRLLPPRPGFPQDMSPEEAEVMNRHLGYWQDLLDREVALAFGPVLHTDGRGGSAYSTSMTSRPPAGSASKTPLCRAAPARMRSCRCSSCARSEPAQRCTGGGISARVTTPPGPKVTRRYDGRLRMPRLSPSWYSQTAPPP